MPRVPGYDKIVSWKGPKGVESHFPAYSRADGVLVNLTNYENELDEDALRVAGVPDNVIEAAKQSKPKGFALLPK